MPVGSSTTFNATSVEKKKAKPATTVIAHAAPGSAGIRLSDNSPMISNPPSKVPSKA